ncbi:hypothetical protein ACP6C3_30750 [Mycolicibacterium septicum]|uniref:Uncharacterized protein n=1 Tax=Mycolicibacterium septicum TaxID=98668 RepID=A0ABW9M5Q2_9MYCO
MTQELISTPGDAQHHRRSRRAESQTVTGQALPRWQFRFPLRHIIIAEVIAGVTVTAMAAAGVPWWGLALAVAAIIVLATLNYRGATSAGWLWRAFHTRRGRKPAVVPEAFGAEIIGAAAIGMRWD